MSASVVPETKDPRDGIVIFKQRWQPTSWKPVYEQIVALHAAGKSNIALAELFDYTPQHICNILKTPEAIRFLAKINENLRKNTLESLPNRLERLTEAAVNIAEDILIDRKDQFLAEAPFKLLDRSLTVLRGVGKLAGDVPKTEVNNHLHVSEFHQKQIAAGLNNLAEVWKIHGGPDAKLAKALSAGDTAEVTEVAEDAKK